MTTEADLQQQVNKAAQAVHLLENPLLKEAFAELEAAYMRTWRQTNINATESREKLWHALNVISDVQAHLARLADDGRLAQAEINRMAGIRTLRKAS